MYIIDTSFIMQCDRGISLPIVWNTLYLSKSIYAKGNIVLHRVTIKEIDTFNVIKTVSVE
jgi:hypothetical protein